VGVVEHVEITCAVTRVLHAVTDASYVGAVRDALPTMRAVCGAEVHPTALTTPPSERCCPACSVVMSTAGRTIAAAS
jgi:hypothetical protein